MNTTLVPATEEADRNLFNGKVIPVDAQDQICQAVAIKNGEIFRAGDAQAIDALAGILCNMIDLNGKQ